MVGVLLSERLLAMGRPGESRGRTNSSMFRQFIALILSEKAGLGLAASDRATLEKLTADFAERS